MCGYINTTSKYLTTYNFLTKLTKIKRDVFMYGEFIKEIRLNKGMSLREFCKLTEIDASNWSKIERGLLAPPQDEEKLKRIAKVLGIKSGSETWKEMKDLANIDAGIIPEDIRSDQEVLKALPMFFRTIRSDKPTAEELDKLIDMIKKES
jgi:transcriptional regulator with XRE-family HTH domain